MRREKYGTEYGGERTENEVEDKKDYGSKK
jgi:hypothetical protein